MTPIQVGLRAVRERAGLSQAALAEKAGVRQATISEMESGKTGRIDLDVLDRLCRALDTTPGELLVLTRSRPARKR
jgi:transcriptional regulator with XRE-family HTH domain